MIRRRQLLIALTAGALAAPLAALAQQRGKVWRIGFLAPSSHPPSLESSSLGAFLRAMRELGYVEGRNFVMEWRFAEGNYECLRELATELVQSKVDVIVAAGSPGTHAAQQATTTIPIVFAAVADPVGSGFATTLARPGGNITGLSTFGTDVIQKQVELLMTMVPSLSRVAVLENYGNPAHPIFLKIVQTATERLGLKVLPVQARTPEEIERGFAMMRRESIHAIMVVGNGFFLDQRRRIAELALKNRAASMFPYREYVEVEGLMSYGQSNADFVRLAATYVDKILKGAKPGELPIEQPVRFQLVINRKTAKTLGLVIPQELLLRADEVIE